MKKSDKENEQLMKQILENQEVEFQESDWEAAQMLIQNANLSAPKKRRRVGFWIFLSLFSLGIAWIYVEINKKETSKNIIVKKEISPAKQKQSSNKHSESEVNNSKSIIYLKKEEPLTSNESLETGSFPKSEIKNATRIPLKRDFSLQQEDYSMKGNFVAENKSSNFAQTPSLTKKTEKTDFVLNNEQFTKKIENQSSITENTFSSNKTSPPQHKVLGIEKPNIRLTPAFFAPQNIPILPDFPEKTNCFSVQLLGGIASSLPKNANYKVAFYGGLQTTYQIHRNFKLLLISELSSRNVQFYNNNISPTSLIQDIGNSNFDYLMACEPSLSISNQAVVTQTSISRDLLYYAGAGIGICIPYKRHEFSITSAFQKVIQTRSKYELQMFENGNLVYQENRKINNFTEGLNNQDITFSIAYQYALNRNLHLQFSGNFGTKDMSNNAYYGNQINDKNTQIRMGIVYRFWH